MRLTATVSRVSRAWYGIRFRATLACGVMLALELVVVMMRSFDDSWEDFPTVGILEC